MASEFNRNKVVLVMVGLPGRGKSFISRKIELFLSWTGIKTKVMISWSQQRKVTRPGERSDMSWWGAGVQRGKISQSRRGVDSHVKSGRIL
jgi:hypothetical protein